MGGRSASRQSRVHEHLARVLPRALGVQADLRSVCCWTRCDEPALRLQAITDRLDHDPAKCEKRLTLVTCGRLELQG